MGASEGPEPVRSKVSVASFYYKGKMPLWSSQRQYSGSRDFRGDLSQGIKHESGSKGTWLLALSITLCSWLPWMNRWARAAQAVGCATLPWGSEMHEVLDYKGAHPFSSGPPHLQLTRTRGKEEKYVSRMASATRRSLPRTRS